MRQAIHRALRVSVIWLLPLASWAAESDAERLFKDGNQFYQEGKFSQALDCYAKLDSLGYQSGALYYNMGNAYYRLGSIGYAILYYEKAARLLGDDEDLLANLELARLRAKDRIQQAPPFFLDAFIERLLDAFSLNVAAIGAVVSFYLFIAVVIAQLQKRSINQIVLKTGFYVALVATAFFIVIFGANSYRDAARSEAVVISPTLNLKSEPNEDGKTIIVVHEGLKVSVARTVDGWLELRLPSGDKGWAKASDVAHI